MISRLQQVDRHLHVYAMRRFLMGVLLLSLLLMLVLFSSATHGAITSFSSREAFDAAFPGAVRETWDEFASGTAFPNGSTVNGITYYSSFGSDHDNSSVGMTAYVQRSPLVTTPPNMLGQMPLGYFESRHEMMFAFTTPLIAFGIDLYTSMDATTNGDYIATTDAGELIGSVYEPFPGFSVGQFIGFSSTVPISSLNISTVLRDPITRSATAFHLDTLRWVPATPVEPPVVGLVPEPATWALFALGLAGMSFGVRRRTGRTPVCAT